MFERMMIRAASRAEARARAATAALAERMLAELPRGVTAEAGEDGVQLSGRHLRRRFALDPALRWLTARLR